jgi:cold shock CspA family protein
LSPADGWPVRRDPRVGVVSSFEADRGLGTVSEEGGSTFPFHCTALTDGSREVEVGRAVLFVVQPGHHGQLEAREVVKR